MVIYKTTNLINGKIYIGQQSVRRAHYFGSGVIIKQAIKKYGRKNFKKEILEKCESKQQLNEREIYWIAYYNSRCPEIGYNRSMGGEKSTLGFKYSDDHKKKLSRAHKNQKPWHKGKTGVYSKEALEKMSEAKKGKKGKPRPEETKKKIGDAHRGRILPIEHRRKLSESHKGKKHSDETKRKMSETHKKLGLKPPSTLGFKRTEESKQKMRDAWVKRKQLTLKII